MDLSSWETSGGLGCWCTLAGSRHPISLVCYAVPESPSLLLQIEKDFQLHNIHQAVAKSVHPYSPEAYNLWGSLKQDGLFSNHLFTFFSVATTIIYCSNRKVKRVFQFFSAHRRREQVKTCSLEDWTLAGASLPASLLPTTKRRVAYGNAFSTSKPVLILSKV